MISFFDYYLSLPSFICLPFLFFCVSPSIPVSSFPPSRILPYPLLSISINLHIHLFLYLPGLHSSLLTSLYPSSSISTCLPIPTPQHHFPSLHPSLLTSLYPSSLHFYLSPYPPTSPHPTTPHPSPHPSSLFTNFPSSLFPPSLLVSLSPPHTTTPLPLHPSSLYLYLSPYPHPLPLHHSLLTFLITQILVFQEDLLVSVYQQLNADNNKLNKHLNSLVCMYTHLLFN